MNGDITIRQFGRLTFNVERSDPEAVSATFRFSDGTNTVEKTVEYDDDGVAYFEFGSPDTDVIGDYDYQVNENFAVGSPDIYPIQDDCDGDCEFPQLHICESIPDEEVES